MSKKIVSVKSGLSSAYSTSEGITVSSTKFNGTQKISAEVYYDEHGEIKSRMFNQSIGVTHQNYIKNNPEFDTCIKHAMTIIWIISLAIIVLISLLGNMMLSIHAITFLIFSVLTKCYSNVPDYIANIYYVNKHPSFSRYHSAEHMAAKASERVDCAPAMDEILKENRFDVRCSTVGLIYYSLTSLIDTLILTFSSVWVTKFFIIQYENANTIMVYMILSIIAIASIFAVKYLMKGANKLISNLLEKEWFVKIFQAPFLKVPTEKELSLAVEAFKIQHRIDRKILRNFDCYETVGRSFDPDDKTVVYETADGTFYKGTIDEYAQYMKNIARIGSTQE